MKKKRKYNINIEDKTKLFFIILFFISGIVLPSFVLIRKEMKKEVTSRKPIQKRKKGNKNGNHRGFKKSNEFLRI